METIHYLRALGRSWLVIVLTSIAGASGGFLVYSHSTPEYASSVELVIATDTSSGIDPVTAQSIAVNQAISAAGIAQTAPAVEDAAAAAGLAGAAPAVSAAAVANQPFIVINVDYGNADAAQRIANAYVNTLPGTINRLGVGSSKKLLLLSSLGPASYPAKPFEPKIRNDVGLGLAVGIVLGIGLIALRELLNQAVQTTEDLQALAGSRVLGTVPRDLPKVPVPVATDPRSRRSEAYRQLRTALLTLSPTVRSIAVTSALPREGKTSVSTNLAVSLSRAGHRVVLIDADLRRPQISKVFELEDGRGLTDVLVGRCGADDVILAAKQAGLFLIPAGTPNASPSELLGSARFDELMSYLVERFDFVVIDTPPVLPVTDALVIGARLDGVVVVTRLGRTTRGELRTAGALIEGTSARVLGYVANQARRLNGRQYRYGYESYAGESAEDVTVSPPVRNVDPAPAVIPVAPVSTTTAQAPGAVPSSSAAPVSASELTAIVTPSTEMNAVPVPIVEPAPMPAVAFTPARPPDPLTDPLPAFEPPPEPLPAAPPDPEPTGEWVPGSSPIWESLPQPQVWEPPPPGSSQPGSWQEPTLPPFEPLPPQSLRSRPSPTRRPAAGPVQDREHADFDASTFTAPIDITEPPPSGRHRNPHYPRAVDGGSS